MNRHDTFTREEIIAMLQIVGMVLPIGVLMIFLAYLLLN